MKYKMNVTIREPYTEEGTVGELFFKTDWEFSKNEKTYGNGYYARLKGEGFDPMGFDLRYDKSFDKAHPEKWIEEWARNYWNGKNGAWMVKEIEITKM